MTKDKLKQDYDFADTVCVRDIDSKVFQAIVYKCLTSIEGVELIGGNILDNLLGRDNSDKMKGVFIDQDEKNHSVNIKVELNVSYGVNIPEKSEEIQNKIAETISSLTGLHVASIHVIFKNIISQRSLDLNLKVQHQEENAQAIEYTDDF